MIRIENIVLGMCATNCYAVFDGGAKTPGGYVDDGQLKEAVIIDPAADAACIEAMIARYKLKPVAVLLTHGHFDHLSAADAVRKRYGIKVYAGNEERPVMNSSSYNLSLPFTGEGMTFEADEYFKPGKELDFAGFKIENISVPGHTIGSVCYYFEGQKVLFSGDTLFAGSVGRSDFPTGNAGQLIRAIKSGLMSLPDDVKVYPGHGESTTIGCERVNNPFIQG
jgi:hydroxyacylglutathione hydrolase